MGHLKVPSEAALRSAWEGREESSAGGGRPARGRAHSQGGRAEAPSQPPTVPAKSSHVFPPTDQMKQERYVVSDSRWRPGPAPGRPDRHPREQEPQQHSPRPAPRTAGHHGGGAVGWPVLGAQTQTRRGQPSTEERRETTLCGRRMQASSPRGGGRPHGREGGVPKERPECWVAVQGGAAGLRFRSAPCPGAEVSHGPASEAPHGPGPTQTPSFLRGVALPGDRGRSPPCACLDVSFLVARRVRFLPTTGRSKPLSQH